MKLPVIRNIVDNNTQADIAACINLMENLIYARGIKDHELDVIGEILSNLHGAVEVNNLINQGVERKEALNTFMKRVTSIGE